VKKFVLGVALLVSCLAARAQTAATPTFSVPGGSYNTNPAVAISDATPGAVVYYTTDGSLPTTASAVYSAPLLVTATTTIKAIAEVPGIKQAHIDETLVGWKTPTCILPGCNPGGKGIPSGTGHTLATGSSPYATFSITSSQSYANALWPYDAGSCDSCSTFSYDFWITLGANSNFAQAFEVDLRQFNKTLGINFMFGMQWDQVNETWDVWNQKTKQWVPTSLHTALSYSAPRHIVINDHRDTANNLVFDSISIDGVETDWNITEPSGPLTPGWSSVVGPQHQIDVGVIKTPTTLTAGIMNATFTAGNPPSAVVSATYTLIRAATIVCPPGTPNYTVSGYTFSCPVS
jgi:hypothetical protein